MAIFEADSLVSVRQDNSLFFHHDGGGMKAIYDQDKFTKLEREAIYKYAGGLMLTKMELFKKENTLLGGRTSHVVVNQKAAMGLFSDFDIKLAKVVAEKAIEKVK